MNRIVFATSSFSFKESTPSLRNVPLFGSHKGGIHPHGCKRHIITTRTKDDDDGRGQRQREFQSRRRYRYSTSTIFHNYGKKFHDDITSINTGGTTVGTTTSREIIVVRHGETDWNLQLRLQGVTDIPLNDKGKAQAQASAKALKDYISEQNNNNNNQIDSVQIYSSPLRRAYDTAQAIADELQQDESTTTVVVSSRPQLQEWNLGCLEGLRKQEATESFVKDWRIFSQWANPLVSWDDARQPLTGKTNNNNNSNNTTASGESMEQVRQRVVQCIYDSMDESRTIETPDEKVAPPPPLLVFVTHGGVLGQLLRHAVGGPSTARDKDDDQNDKHTTVTTKLACDYGRPGNACISRFGIDIPPSSMMTGGQNNASWKILSWADTSHLKGDLAPVGSNYDDKRE